MTNIAIINEQTPIMANPAEIASVIVSVIARS
jgi:hypothetical protein